MLTPAASSSAVQPSRASISAACFDPGWTTETTHAVTLWSNDSVGNLGDHTYEYQVDGTSYVGSRYSFGEQKDPSFNSSKKAQTWIDENCPVDAGIPVHYNPDQPDVSVVEPGTWRSLITVLFGLAFLAVSGQYVGDIRLGQPIEQFGRGYTFGLVHAHIQWSIGRKTESACCTVKLR